MHWRAESPRFLSIWVTDYIVPVVRSHLLSPSDSARPDRAASPDRPRRRRPLVALSAAAVILVLLAGCTTESNTPSEYGIVTQSNFLKGCLASFGVDVDGEFDVTATTNIVIPEDATSQQTSYCNCVYDGFREPVLDESGDEELTEDGSVKTELPFSDFKQINTDLKNNLSEDGSTDTTTTEDGGSGPPSNNDSEAQLIAALGDNVSQGAQNTMLDVLDGCKS
jgi:hypothetical protein